jgi:hypothetical protein
MQEVTASYTMTMGRNQTIAEVERLCIEQARIKALSQLSTSVHSRTNYQVSDNNGVVKDKFNAFESSQVLGTWLYDVTEPEVTWTSAGTKGEFTLSVNVHGMVRPYTEEGKTELSLKVLKRTEPNGVPQESDTFKENDLISIEVTAADSGSIYVFYVDHFLDTAYLFLPNTEENNKLKSRKPTKFLDKYNYFTSVSDVGNGVSNDEIIVLYSKGKLDLPILLEENNLQKLSDNNLQKWLSLNLINRTDLSVERKLISIQLNKQND